MMLWIGTVVAFAVGLAVLVTVSLVRRSGDLGSLGSVSPRWIAEHRVDSRGL